MISPVKIWRRQKEIRKILGKKGKIISWTKIFVTSKDFKRYSPYVVLMIKLESNEKIILPLVDYDEDDLKIGNEVIVTLRKVREGSPEGVIAYGLKARLL